MITPQGDWLKIKLEAEGAFSAKAGDAASSGILAEVPEFTHYGYYSFGFENSLMNNDLLEELIEHWESLKGKRLYWLSLSEKGAIMEEPSGERFAFVKPTSIMGWSEPDDKAEAVLDAKGGSFA